MDYTSKQKEFLALASMGSNIFLTGKAGTGKTFITKELKNSLDEQKVKYVAVAPTGVAANNIGGQTIHSLFGIPPYGVLDFDACNHIRSEKRRLLQEVKVIIIDEVSMLRPDILDAMNWTLIKNGCDPLHTKQIIFIGDLMQLPPVITDNDRAVLWRTYNGDNFHFAKVYDKIAPVQVELDEIVRQQDPEFINALNNVRNGVKDEYFRQFSIKEIPKDSTGIILAPYNATVQAYNEAGLKEQKGDIHTFRAAIEGNVKADDFNMESVVNVKTGCKIMYLVNSSDDNQLFNGTLGIFVHCDGLNYIRVGDLDYPINPVKQVKKVYVYKADVDALVLEEVGSIEQMPIKLAYALSIHKSQGLTFDEVTVDLTLPCFQNGQMYVGLSRVRTPQGLKIKVN